MMAVCPAPPVHDYFCITKYCAPTFATSQQKLAKMDYSNNRHEKTAAKWSFYFLRNKSWPRLMIITRHEKTAANYLSTSVYPLPTKHQARLVDSNLPRCQCCTGTLPAPMYPFSFYPAPMFALWILAADLRTTSIQPTFQKCWFLRACIAGKQIIWYCYHVPLHVYIS